MQAGTMEKLKENIGRPTEETHLLGSVGRPSRLQLGDTADIKSIKMDKRMFHPSIVKELGSPDFFVHHPDLFDKQFPSHSARKKRIHVRSYGSKVHDTRAPSMMTACCRKEFATVLGSLLLVLGSHTLFAGCLAAYYASLIMAIVLPYSWLSAFSSPWTTW